MYRERTVAVTGASAGLGREFAKELSRRGVGHLVLIARRRERLEALAEELPCPCSVEVVDLTVSASVDALIRRHRVDVLINNAGFGDVGRFDQTRNLTQLALNCEALTRLIDGWLPGMLERRDGGILNVGSAAGWIPVPSMATYGASKAYVISLSEALNIELRGTGVKVSCLAPGPVATEFFEVAAKDGLHPPPWVMQRPETTVRAALRGLERNRPVVIPGLHIKLAMALRRRVPEWLVRGMMAVYCKVNLASLRRT